MYYPKADYLEEVKAITSSLPGRQASKKTYKNEGTAMVLYFTGTGNSRYLARRIAEGLDMPLYDLNTCIKAGDTAPVQTGQDVVLVTPTYAWRIPRVVSQWLGNTELTGAERIWFVMDCGSEIGNAAKYNRQLAAQKHLRYMGTAQITMPENYIAMFHAPQAEQARRIVEQAEPALQKVLAQVRAGQEFPPPRDTLYDRFMSGPVNPAFYHFFVKADAFRATDACIGCGKCVELCPLNNIRLENGKPVWGKHCTHCMACICDCPKEAIEYGKKSKGKPRYHFEALEKQRTERVTKRILTEEEMSDLSDKLMQVTKGMTITVRYFVEDTAHPEIPAVGNYVTLTGRVESIDPVFRTLQIAKVVVPFEDLVEVRGDGIVAIDDHLGIAEPIESMQ